MKTDLEKLLNIERIIEYNEEMHVGLDREEDFKTIDETEVDEYLKWYKQTPDKEEIQQEMELHNADEVGINNQWTFEDAEYHLLLSDEYNHKN